MTEISSFHAHIYFDASSIDLARRICRQASVQFDMNIGRVHEKPVGPHPMWSCQLEFGPDQAGDVIPWLAMNREGLTVFIHPETGDVIRDHTDHAIWMGKMMDINLSAFR